MPEFWDSERQRIYELPDPFRAPLDTRGPKTPHNHTEFGDGVFVTQGYTSDPNYPDGSTFTSIGRRGGDHVTGIFGPDGQFIENK